MANTGFPSDPFNKFGSVFNTSNGFNSPMPPSSGVPKQNKNQIITSLYRSILGREPDPSALMYYISQPEIDENLVRKQMVESDEHKQIIEEYKKIATYGKEIEDLKTTISLKDKAIEDKNIEVEHLNKILHHKSDEINKLNEEMGAQQKNKTEMPTSSQLPPLSQNMLLKQVKKILHID